MCGINYQRNVSYPKESNNKKRWKNIPYNYQIDNQGANNKLYAAEALWDPKDKVVDNRQVRYGTSDITGKFWKDGPTVKYPTNNNTKYVDPKTYSGLTLRCQTKIDVVNVGTVTCNVTSGILTK